MKYKNLFFDLDDTIWAWVEYGEGKITKDELNRQRFFYPLMSVGVEDEALAEQFSKDFFSIIPTKRGLMPYAKEVLEYLAPKYNLIYFPTVFVNCNHARCVRQVWMVILRR